MLIQQQYRTYVLNLSLNYAGKFSEKSKESKILSVIIPLVFNLCSDKLYQVFLKKAGGTHQIVSLEYSYLC